jgi:predicted RNA-binding protein YlqC (UPF0109 family)
MEKTTEIKFRKEDNGKFRAIIRGGRNEQTFKTIKTYNRQKEKQVCYEN